MSRESRRALMQDLIVREAAAGHAIDRDADFMSLVERWIEGDIDMVEFRRQFLIVREKRLKQNRLARTTSPDASIPLEPMPSSDEVLTEIAPMTRADFTE